MTLSCALSRDSRRTQPGSYASSRDTEYLENSCVPSEELSCEYKRTENAYPRYLDTIVTRYETNISALHTNILSIPSCSGCLTRSPARSSAPSSRTSRVGASHSTPGETEGPNIFCLFTNIFPSASQCFISGDDQTSARSGALQSRPGTDYFERSCDAVFSSVEETENLILDTGVGATSGTARQISNKDTVTFDLTCAGEGVIGSSLGLQTAQQETRCRTGRLQFEKTTGKNRNRKV